jgi:predicted SAM-dependent methyltransferase
VEAPDFVLPKKKTQRGLAIGIPSFGMVSINFLQSCTQLGLPINFGAVYMSPMYCRWNWKTSKVEADPTRTWNPVADARNIIAQACIDGNVEWLFFRDDDTICPPDALNKLFSTVQWTAANGLRVPIVGGCYWSKQKPPHPLMLLENDLSGQIAFKMGDMVKCMAIGMGCTLIHVPALKAIKPPWFRTCTGQTDEEYHPEVFGKDPLRCTEDVYFCRLAAHAGHETWCDTSIQCIHEDFDSKTAFYYDQSRGIPVWATITQVGFYTPLGHPEFANQKKRIAEERSKQLFSGVKLNLGCGGDVRPGWVNVDLTVQHPEVTNLDITDGHSLAAMFKDVEEIWLGDVIEHLPLPVLVRSMRDWVTLLKPGGKLTANTPDGPWAAQNYVKYAAKSNIDDPLLQDAINRFYGSRRYPGDAHELLLDENHARQLFETAGLENVVVEKIRHGDGPENGKDPGDCVQLSLQISGTRPELLDWSLFADDFARANGAAPPALQTTS